MRLRQLCCHPDLSARSSSDAGAPCDTKICFLIIFSPLPCQRSLDIKRDALCRPGAAATTAELRERLIEKLRLVLASGSDEECSVCLDSVRLPVITHCAHVYCRPCITQVIGTEQVPPRLWLMTAAMRRRLAAAVAAVLRSLLVLFTCAARNRHAAPSVEPRSRLKSWWSSHRSSWRRRER